MCGTPKRRMKAAIFACAVVAASSLIVNMTPSAASGGERNPYFAGNETAPPPTTTESASATVNVPTLDCVTNLSPKEWRYLLLFQELEAAGGESWAEVIGQCHRGKATYLAEAIACTGYAGCNRCPIPTVSPGDSVTLSEYVGPEPDSDVTASVDDTTSGASADCLAFDAGADGGDVFTGACATVYDHELFSASSKPNPQADCGSPPVPSFSAVSFTDVSVNGGSIPPGSQFFSLWYDSTREVKTGNLKDNGESFKEFYVGG